MKSKINNYRNNYIKRSKVSVALLIAILVSISSFAQQGINYKALIKDDLGNVVANQEIEVRFFIFKSGGGLEYNEDHLTTTDANGLVVLTIGQGSPGQFQDFTTINWGEDDYVLRVGIDLELDSSFVYFDDTPFNAVPYALLAENVRNQTFKSDNGITFSENTTDDFVFGSMQLDDSGTSLGDSRMFFNVGKGSFRAGRALDNEWDDQNIGNRSVAFGLNTIAAGYYSTALGNRTNAESYASTAIGTYNVGGGNPNAWVDTDPLFEIGNGTATISTESRSNALTVLKNGKVGIGYESETPTQTLDVSGKLKVANDFTAPTPGTIRFNETTNAFEGYIDEIGWITLGEKKREKTIVIPSSQFIGRGIDNSSWYGNNFIYGSDTDVIEAPLVLPINSRILNITCVFKDFSSELDLTFSLVKHCGDSGQFISDTIIGGYGLINWNSSDFTTISFDVDETVASTCQYRILAQSQPSEWDEMVVYKVYVTYIED
ncbi:hypothetical protein [Winogradskyella bathintestinalis]|uniref:Trimeric autotransporter adhesin YadA-like head domain-containing protein n=1 Tax=Winogradskyella bathintestinalis TaxID=3035208 RepID=A0ABT7ZWR6_9FLAO|nr:hypothetical protein [Winogradskyella bathintestinalis]MDN3493455.1 hypothetical protein [Winogradskyella bathintestinalis]